MCRSSYTARPNTMQKLQRGISSLLFRQQSTMTATILWAENSTCKRSSSKAGSESNQKEEQRQNQSLNFVTFDAVNACV